ncbi:MAG: hypothetical protein Q8J68_02005 [Methanolobus sp.]|uniref:hypothetical protein n=1 Tax=Methanolobus sp. TaxID=1874737 RepID=UPI002731EAA5|nr:hypothetical protein [Methanolobus sp.]MDP2216050.1 hypothetical protein [Methanolobus sp.]
MSEKIPLPVLNNHPGNQAKKSVSCNSCGTGGCRGGFGIKQGSEKEEVFKVIFLYVAMGIIMFVAAYGIMRLLSLIGG